MSTVDRLSDYTQRQLEEARATDYARYITCRLQARAPERAAELFVERFPRSLSASLVAQHVATATKAAVAAGTTTDATWAGPLAAPQALSDGFLAIVRPLEVLAQLDGVLRAPLNTPIPVWVPTSVSAAVWTGQGQLKALAAFNFATATLAPTKLAVTCAVTKELLTLNTDAARVLRDILVFQVITGVNKELLDPTKAPVAGVSPGSLTNAGTLVASVDNSATDAANVLKALLNARPQTMSPTLVMDVRAAATLRATNQHPDLLLTGGTAFGAKVIVVPAAGLTIAAIDPSAVLLNDQGIELDATRSASIIMDSAPVNGAAAVHVSLFQQNLVALRAERFVSWKLTDPLACQHSTRTTP